MVLFSSFFQGSDMVSSAGSDSIDHWNCDLMFCVALGEGSDDVWEGDDFVDSWRCLYNTCYNDSGRQAFSYQGQNGGPWYIVGNHVTGMKKQTHNFPTVNGVWKFRSNSCVGWVAHNTFLVDDTGQKGVGDLDTANIVFTGNAWYDTETGGKYLGTGFSLTTGLAQIWDYNAYDTDNTDGPDGETDVFDGVALSELQALGADTNSSVVIMENVMENTPADYTVGTLDTLRPTSGGALHGGGVTSGDKPNGFDNLVGPYLGSRPDIGCVQRGIGKTPVGPRDHDDRLAYLIPDGWSAEATSNVSNYTGIGLPSSDSSNSRKLISRDSGVTGAIYVDFVPTATMADAWNEYDDILDGEVGDTIVHGPLYFRDGLGVTVVTRGGNTQLLCARVEDGGVVSCIGGMATGDLTDVLQEDFFYFFRSLYTEWGLIS